jgi:hypothetical protein
VFFSTKIDESTYIHWQTTHNSCADFLPSLQNCSLTKSWKQRVFFPVWSVIFQAKSCHFCEVKMGRKKTEKLVSKCNPSCSNLENKQRGESHCGLAVHIKKYLNAKEELWKLKYFNMQKYSLQKSSKRNQNPSRCCSSIITYLKFQHKPKYHSKILI